MEKIRQLITKLFGKRPHRIEFIYPEINQSVMFQHKVIVDEFEKFLQNEIVQAINKKNYEKARRVDESFGKFIDMKEAYYSKIEETSEKPAVEQIKEVYKEITPVVLH